MKTKIYVYLMFNFVIISVNAQSKLTGTIKDAITGELLIGATVQVDGTNDAVKTDINGAFNLSTRKVFPFSLTVNYVGYRSQKYIIASLENTYHFELRQSDNLLNSVVVTARRRVETAQNIPIPVTVITGHRVAEAGAFNVNRLKELVPTVQFYSSNPRNSALSIRGLGTTFGLTNDGIDPGVGFYVDGVYYARPAATTIDFIDIEQIEILRGPQGTLFGKNTTAGAFNVTTRKPSFEPGSLFELSFGNYGFIQAKASITGPINNRLAARISFSGTQRDGNIYNQYTETFVNDINNIGIRGQLLYKPSDNTGIIFAADVTRQRPNGYAQVFAGVIQTQRPAYRQFEQIIADLNYTVPSRNPFDRIIDHDTPARSFQDLAGASVNADVKLGTGTLTSTTAWRYWKWNPSNDRDFTGIEALRLSQAPSVHNQWSQELRWAGEISKKVSAVVGAFAFYQHLKSDSVHTEEAGKYQWRFSQSSTSLLWQTQGLLNGYGINSKSELNTFSGALFGQIDWSLTDRFSILPGARINYDVKKVFFSRNTYGGLETSDPALIALKNAVYNNQEFEAEIGDFNFSGQITAAFELKKEIRIFSTISTSYKPVGLNLGGLPHSSDGKPLTDLAVVKPEKVNHIEIGLKSSPTSNTTLNLTVYNTDIKDYQTQVQSPELGVNRGFLANAEKVRVRGAEVEGDIQLGDNLRFNVSFAYTDGEYARFTNAPLPLEETGMTVDGVQVAFKDVSGGVLPGISKWAGSLGGEYSKKGKFWGSRGRYFFASDIYFRSEFSSSPSPSAYLNVPGYLLVNVRLGFRTTGNATWYIWGRNIFNKNYFEQLLPGAGNAGQYAAVPGDPATYGVTLKYSL